MRVDICHKEGPTRNVLSRKVMVSVVMPCLNEERTVGGCVEKACRAFHAMGLPGEVVVSDNGSTDDSVKIAEQAGARVVHCPARGYGNAVRYGVEEAQGEYVVMGDADASYDFATIGRFIEPLKDGADLVMGNRFLGGIRPGAMPWKNRYLGNPLLTKVLNVLFHAGVGDAHCGLRSFSRSAFWRMQLESPGMEFASEMVVKAAKRRMHIVEVPTTLDPDGRDRPPHLAPWRDGWRHLKFLLMFSPLHLFVLPAVLLMVVGVALLVLPSFGLVHFAGYHMGTHWAVLGSLLTLLAAQIMEFGTLARLYTIEHRFREEDRALNWFRRSLSLEIGLLLSGGLFTCGMIMDSWILWEWIDSGFGPLARIELSLIATVLMALGAQLGFFFFLFAIMNERPSTNAEAERG